MLFLYYPFRNEEHLFSENSHSYIEKLNEPGVINIVNQNRCLIEPFSELVQQAFEQFLNNQLDLAANASAQQENYEDINSIEENEEEREINQTVNIASTISISSTLLTDLDINARNAA